MILPWRSSLCSGCYGVRHTLRPFILLCYSAMALCPVTRLSYSALLSWPTITRLPKKREQTQSNLNGLCRDLEDLSLRTEQINCVVLP